MKEMTQALMISLSSKSGLVPETRLFRHPFMFFLIFGKSRDLAVHDPHL